MKKIFKSLFLIVMILLTMILLTGCDKKEEKSKAKEEKGIVGVWKYESADYVYTFNEDGTGVYDAMGTKMEFTYELDGNKISILYTDNTVPFETEYTIKGDTLNVKDSFGEDTIYKRKK